MLRSTEAAGFVRIGPFQNILARESGRSACRKSPTSPPSRGGQVTCRGEGGDAIISQLLLLGMLDRKQDQIRMGNLRHVQQVFVSCHMQALIYQLLRRFGQHL